MTTSALTAARPERARIAVVDMAVSGNSPAGSCVKAEIEGLVEDFDVTVFTQRCDLPSRPGLEIVHVAAPERPVLLRYMVFHLGMPWHFMLWRARGGRAAVVQATQGQWPGADVAYAHYCHAAYLRTQWKLSTSTGLRRAARWCTHWFNAWSEARAFERAAVIVAPSRGLQRELALQYPEHVGKVRVLANPVAIDRFRCPEGFDRRARRTALGFGDDHIVFAFMALGDFARKGLGLLIESLGRLAPQRRAPLRLLVIGGRAGEVAEFTAMAQTHGVADQMVFAGMQREVAPFLWSCDGFAFPSAYEIFSLAILQAAAAGLPVLVARGLYGAEEFVVDGHNGWVVEREVSELQAWWQHVVEDRDRLPAMGHAACESAASYDAATFRLRWRALFAELVGAAA